MSFADLAQVKASTVERPKPVPEGHYVAQFTGPMKEHVAKSKNTAMRFPFRPVAPGDDVDAEQLEAAGGLPDKDFNLDFWMSPDARYRFTEFCQALGANMDLNLLELAEWLAQERPQFLIQCKHEPNNEKPEDPPFMRWDNPTAVE